MIAHAPLVYVVDDDEKLARSVVFLVASAGWAGRAFADPDVFLDSVAPDAAGCAVLDIRMPRMSGLELMHAMRARGIRLPVIFITGHGDITLAVEAMKQGARDFLEKPFRDQALLDAIAAAVRASEADVTAQRELEEVNRRVAQLTPREREVAVRVAGGMPNKAIARELDISDKTVQVHRAHVLEKMGVHSATGLANLLARVRLEDGGKG